MTPEQIQSDPTTHERMAKRWCEIMGLDPNEKVVRIVYPEKDDDFVRRFDEARWEQVARQVPAQLAWIRVMMEVAE